MRRTMHVIPVLGVVLLGLLAAGRPLVTNAQDATPMAGQEFVGSWRLTVTEAQVPPFIALGTFGADGTVVVSPPPVVPPSPHGPDTVVHTSAGHGTRLSSPSCSWRPTRRAAYLPPGPFAPDSCSAPTDRASAGTTWRPSPSRQATSWRPSQGRSRLHTS